jgi:hypothetical protein
MPKPQSGAKISNAEPGLSKYQKFKIERFNRADIKNAPYNPRTIDPYARKKLEANLKKVGLLETLIVNKRTGNLVSGHQRLACLDALEGNGEYQLDVAVVDLTEKQEREQNIWMNNPAGQGTWDVAALGDMLKGDIDVDATGFDPMDVQVLLGPDAYNGLFDAEKAPEAVKDAVADVVGVVDAAKEKKKADREALKARRKEFTTEYSDKLDTEFYLVVLFNSRAESGRFLKAIGKEPDERYVDGRALASSIGVDLGDESTAAEKADEEPGAQPRSA